MMHVYTLGTVRPESEDDEQALFLKAATYVRTYIPRCKGPSLHLAMCFVATCCAYACIRTCTYITYISVISIESLTNVFLATSTHIYVRIEHLSTIY